MKNIKSFLKIIFASCVISVAVGCSDSEDATPVPSLLDFTDKSVTAEFGDIFSCEEYSVAKDEEGIFYNTTVSVKTADGKDVLCVKKSFKIEETTDYVATVTARGKGWKQERKITVTPQDTLPPTLRIGDMSEKCGKIGGEYELPEYYVYDASGVKSKNISYGVWYVNGEQEERQTVTENKFFAAKSGKYEIRLSAKDNFGQSNTVKQDFYVRADALDNEIESFTEPPSADSVRGVWYGSDLKSEPVSHLDEFEGAQGVVKLSYRSTHDKDFAFTYSLIPRKQIAEYAGGQKVIIKAYVPKSSNIQYIQLGEGAEDKVSRAWLNTDSFDKWVDYEFDFAVFENLWSNDISSSGLPKHGKIFLRLSKVNNEGGEIYIDSITVVPKGETLVTPVSAGGKFCTQRKIAFTVSNSVKQFKVFAPDGNEVQLSENGFTPINSGKYTVQVICEGYAKTIEYSFIVEKADTDTIEDFDNTAGDIQWNL